MLFIKKPIPVEAIRVPLHKPTSHEYFEWSKTTPEWLHSHEIWMTDEGLIIPTLEGNMLCRWGNWIIQGVHKEIYPCDADVFEETYEEYTSGN